MNTITLVVTILVLWLIMGLGFMTAYADARRNGRSRAEAWRRKEGVLFVASVAIPLIIGFLRMIG